MNLLIKNVHAVDGNKDFYGDIYIKGGRFCSKDSLENVEYDTIDGKGLTAMPAFVDMHTHFRDPGYTYKEDIKSGSYAAVAGGYTFVNLMPNTKPVCSSMDTVEYVRNKANEAGLIDVHQCVSITRNFDGCDISHLDEIDDSIRVITEDGNDVDNNYVMYSAMKKAKEKNIIVMCHSEDKKIAKENSRLSEDLMVSRNLELAKSTHCKLHLAHVSTKKALSYIISAKDEGFDVTCEVMPHNIVLTDDIDYRVNPPLRKKEDTDYIINAIKHGYVDMIATDHAPHTKLDKENGAPGISGIETAFCVCYTSLVKEGYIGINKLSKLMSMNPSKRLGINKGLIENGFDGDIVLIDLESKFKIDENMLKSRGKNTPFLGMEFYGQIIATIKGGKIVYEKRSNK